MALYFFDTSALVKRYALEDGRKWVQGLTDPAISNQIYIARITGAEVIAAIMQNVRERHTTSADATKVIADFRFDFANQYQVVEITEAVVARAMALIESYKLRGYDGVQLATALELNDLILSTGLPAAGGSALSLASADGDINLAAAAEALSVENPQTYLHPDDKTP
jgi:predicted nucleic acid-binding protein